MDESKAVELYRKHRPRRLCDVVGQPRAVAQLEEMLKRNRVPRALLFCGGSGVGKTTLARILARKLGCGRQDFQEINAASERGIDVIRDIEHRMGLAPISGDCRIWLLDEVHQLTKRKGGDAQTALLKVLEDVPGHVYFFLCTTEPAGLLKTIRTRCTDIHLKSIAPDVLEELVRKVLAAENRTLSKAVMAKVAEAADGSARKALVLLHQVLDLPGEDEQLDVLERGDRAKTAYELARMLVWERGVTWTKVAATINGLDEGEDWEQLRRLVLACASKEALKSGGNGRAIAVLDAFKYNWYDTGRSGLVLACHDVVNAKR